MNWHQLSDQEIVNELTGRIRQKRLNINMTQQQLADKAGVHVQTIKNLEAGGSATLQTLVQVLRAFNELDFLDKFIPEPGLSPIELLKLKGKERERASGHKNREEDQSEW